MTLPVIASYKVAPVKLIPETSTPLKSPLVKSTDGPTIYPCVNWYFMFSGCVVIVKRVEGEPVTPPDDVFVKIAFVKLLPEISTPLKLPFVKSYPLISSPGPTMCLAVTLYPVVIALGTPTTLLDRIRVNTAFDMFAPDTSTALILTPEKSAPLKLTPGPTM